MIPDAQPVLSIGAAFPLLADRFANIGSCCQLRNTVNIVHDLIQQLTVLISLEATGDWRPELFEEFFTMIHVRFVVLCNPRRLNGSISTTKQEAHMDV